MSAADGTPHAAGAGRRGGPAPLGLALLLERGGVTLVAPPQALAPGLDLLELTAAVPGARPSSAGGCRGRACAATLLRLRVADAALLGWLRARLVGAALPGWRIEHVAWDMVEGTGDAWAWSVRGADDAGEPVWLRLQLSAGSQEGRLWLRPRRCWLLGPASATAEATWRALARRLVGTGVALSGGRLEIDALRAALGPGFAAAGWSLPGRQGLVAEELRVEDAALRVTLRAGGEARTWPEGQVSADDVNGFDPLAEARVWARGSAEERGWADAALRRWALEVPELAAALGRARARMLRFVDRDACVAALREWSSAAPQDPEPRWLLVAQQAMRGDAEGLIAALAELEALPGAREVTLRRRLARALVLQRREARAGEARALLEPMVAELGALPAELQAGVWRALARARAADAAAPGGVVEDAVAAALGEEGWRRRGETGELRAQVAAALVGSGRAEADTTQLLRRMLGDERPERATRRSPAIERGPGERPPARASRAEDPRASTRIVADYYAQEGRWSELVTLLGRELVHLDGVARIQALRRIARIHRHYLHDPASAEQALRVALSQPAEDEGTLHDRQLLHGELVTCLEMQGRFAEAVAHLEGALADLLGSGPGGDEAGELSAGTGESELSAGTGGDAVAGEDELAPERAELLVRLGRLARDGLDDEVRAAPAFAALLRAGAVPDDGLATLTRVYRADGRHVALVEVLRLRLARVDAGRAREHAAELRRRLAELLDGPLGRADEAAPEYLAAYLDDPAAQAACGARARALLAGGAAAQRRAAVLQALAMAPGSAVREVLAWTVAAEAADGEEAEQLFRAALAAGGGMSERTGGAGAGEVLAEAGGGQLAERTGDAGAGGEALAGWTGPSELLVDAEAEGLSAAVGAAAAGLGRVLLGLGRVEEAARVLGFAAGRAGLADGVAIDCAVLAAQTFATLGRAAEAEAVLARARRERAADERVLLELSKVLDLQGRGADEDAVLAELLALAGRPALRAEVLLRRAQLRDYAADPRGPAGGEALALLQAAFAEDPRHVDVRDALRALAEARGAWPTVVQTIAAALRGLPPGPERAALHLDLAEVHLLHLADPASAARNLERAFSLAPADALVRGRVVTLMWAARRDMFEETDGDALLAGLADSAELGPAARAGLWLTLGELRLRARDLGGAGAAWQRVFALAPAGAEALATARQHLEALGEGGDLQAQRVALQRLLADEDQAEERLHILTRLRELGQALADEALVESTCRETLALLREQDGQDEAREAAVVGLRGLLARRGEVAEIAALYAELEAAMLDGERAARCLVEAARFAGQVVHDGALAGSLALRAWRRAPASAAVQGLVLELAEHPAHGSALLSALAGETLTATPGLALRLADAANRHGRIAAARGWFEAIAQAHTGGLRRAALVRLDGLLAATSSARERLPVLRALVTELRGEAAQRAGEGGAEFEDLAEGTGASAGASRVAPEFEDLAEGTGASAGAEVGELAEGTGASAGDPDVSLGAGAGEAGAWALVLARLELELGEVDAALRTCLPGPVAEAREPALLELAAELLVQRERWDELTALCERRAELAAQAGDGATESAWWTQAAQVCIDHATQPRRAMNDARRLLLRACAADPRGEAARASLVPLSFAEHRWDEVLQVAGELRELAGAEHDVQIVAAVTEAFVHGRSELARAIGARHESATLRRLLWPAVARVLTEVARAGTLAQLDAVLATAAALHGSAARLRIELQAWSAGRPLQAGLTLGLARLRESIGHVGTARSLLQLVAFMVPQGPLAAKIAELPPLAVPPDVLANDHEPALESREALRAVLRRMAEETAGIRAIGPALDGPGTPEEREALALAEAELAPLRVALGLPLPLLIGRGGPDGGVSVRNDRPPAIVVSAALVLLPAAERRFRLAHAAAMIASGLAIVTDPQGASLPELLAALLHLADETCPARLPGAQTIVRACAARGFKRERLPAGLREALAREVARWQHSRDSVARLAHLLRRDSLRVAARLSGSLDGALRTVGRDARLLPAGPLDERGAAQVLASEDAQWLLRSLGVFA